MMEDSLDTILINEFTPEKIIACYKDYKKKKVDSLRAQHVPSFSTLRIAEGASLEEIMAMDDLQADFPAWDRVDGHSLIRIPIGADGITFQTFEKEIRYRALQIAQRIADGRYLFYPFREVIVTKEKDLTGSGLPETRAQFEVRIDGKKTRILSVATIRDTIVQIILYRNVLCAHFEDKFSALDRRSSGKPYPVSFAYRPGKSPQRAAKTARAHMQEGFVHVLDADLRSFFDTIPREPLLDVCKAWLGNDNPLTLKLLRRFVHVDRVTYCSYHWARNSKKKLLREGIFHTRKPEYYDAYPDSNRPQRYNPQKGIPQGGVLSGLLANLYLHSFDEWICHELTKRFDLRYVRYADDFLVLFRSKEDVLPAYQSIKEKLEGDVAQGGLELNMHGINLQFPEDPACKTRYISANVMPVKFVGFEISPQSLRIHPDNVERFKRKWIDAVATESALREEWPDPNQRLYKLIKLYLAPKVRGMTQYYTCKCGEMRGKKRSWIAFYADVTDWRQILSIEIWMRKQIYKQFREQIPNLTRHQLTQAGLPSLIRECKRARKMCAPCPNCRRIRDNQGEDDFPSEGPEHGQCS